MSLFFYRFYIYIIDSLLLFINLKIILLIYSILNLLNLFIFIKMSLFIIRTLDIKLSFNYIKNSFYNTRFLLYIFNIKLELKGRYYWPISYKDDYTYYLKRSNN